MIELQEIPTVIEIIRKHDVLMRAPVDATVSAVEFAHDLGILIGYISKLEAANGQLSCANSALRLWNVPPANQLCA